MGENNSRPFSFSIAKVSADDEIISLVIYHLKFLIYHFGLWFLNLGL